MLDIPATPTLLKPPSLANKVGSTSQSNVNNPKKSKFKTCCAKVWAVVKKIFSCLFCCCLCRPKPQQPMEANKFKKLNAEYDAQDAKAATTPPPPVSIFSTTLDSDAKLKDWKLLPTTDPCLMEIQTFVSELINVLVIDSEFQTGYQITQNNSDGSAIVEAGIKPTVLKIGEWVKEATVAEALKTNCKDMAPWIHGTKRIFDEASNNESTITSLFNFNSIISIAPKVTPHLVYALHKHLNKGALPDKKVIAQHVFKEIYSNIKNDSYRSEFRISDEELLFFTNNEVMIQNFIISMVEGIIPEGISTKEIVEIFHDILRMISYFTEISGTLPPQTPRISGDLSSKIEIRDEIFNEIQKFGENFKRDLLSIEQNIIKMNTNTIIQHIVSRIADVLSERKARRKDKEYIYPVHQGKIDTFIKSIPESLNAVTSAENERLSFLKASEEEIEKAYVEALSKLSPEQSNYEQEFQKLVLQKETDIKKAGIRGERTFIKHFAVQPACNEKIRETIKKSDKTLEDTIDDMRRSFVTEITQDICRLILRPAPKKDSSTGKEFEVPWLRVLWNSLEKPVELENLINSGNHILDNILKIPGLALSDNRKFRSKFISLIQRLTVHIINREIEQAVEKYVVQTLFDMLGDKRILFKMLFDMLIISKVSIALNQKHKDFDQDFCNLHNARGEEEKQKQRIIISDKLYKIFGDHEKFQFENEGIKLEDFRAMVIKQYIMGKIESHFNEIFTNKTVKITDISTEFEKYNNSSNDLTDINHLSPDIHNLLHKLVFELGKLDITGTKTAMSKLKGSIFNLFSNFLIPMRNSPYYFLDMYKNTLQDRISTSGKIDTSKSFTYFLGQKGGQPVVQEPKGIITDQQYTQFCNLFHDVLVAPLNGSFKGKAVRWYLSDKVLKLEQAVRSIFDGLAHSAFELNSLMKLRDVYVA